jgi:hypothetical protein
VPCNISTVPCSITASTAEKRHVSYPSGVQQPKQLCAVRVPTQPPMGASNPQKPHSTFVQQHASQCLATSAQYLAASLPAQQQSGT